MEAESRAGWDDQWPGAPGGCRKRGILWLQGASAPLVPLYGAFLSWARALGEKGRASHPIQVLSAGSGGLERAGQGRARSGRGSALGLLGSLAPFFPGVVSRPQRQVVSQQLHDES